MKNERNSRVYQTVLIDLALAGALDKSIAEQLLGYTIPESITSPVTVTDKKADKKKKPASTKTEESAE